MISRAHTYAMLVALVIATAARAAVSPPGVNIRCDNCFDDGGVMNKTFACDTNAGVEELVLSFVLADAMPGVSGQRIDVHIHSASAPSGRLRIDHVKTTGTDACAGCTDPVCILFSSINLITPNPADNRLVSAGANDVDSQLTTWQYGSPRNLEQNCDRFGCFPTFECVVGPPTSARNSTWGSVKALYR